MYDKLVIIIERIPVEDLIQISSLLDKNVEGTESCYNVMVANYSVIV